MPDYQGLFLRGRGSYDAARASAALGQVQEDAMRPITGEFSPSSRLGLVSGNSIFIGAFKNGVSGRTTGIQTLDGRANNNVGFDSSLLGLNYAGTETRPANTAVRWMVRALK